VRTVWTTDPGPDPALLHAFAADQPAALATTVVGGVEAVVTLVDEHEDFDCHLGDLHHQRCPKSGMRVWDRATGALIRAISDVCDNGTGGGVLVTVVVDGRPLAVVRDWARPPKVVDLETGHRIGTLSGHDDATGVQDMFAVNLADGPGVVTAGWDGMLRVTALASGRTATIATGERLNAVTVVSLAGRPVAATGRDALTLWDLTDGTQVGALTLAEGQVPAAIVSWPDRDPLIAVLAFDGRIAVWNAGTGDRRVLGLPRAPRPWGITAAHAFDGRPLLAVEDGESVSLWDVHADAPYRAPLVGPVQRACMLADGPGILLVGSRVDNALSVWRLTDDEPQTRSGSSSDIRCLTVTHDGWIVAGGGDGHLGRWRLADGARGADLGSLPGQVNAIASASNGAQTYLLAVGGDLHGITDGMLHRWTGERPEPAIALDHRGDARFALTLPVDGDPAVVTAGSDGHVHLTHLRTGTHLATITDTYPPRGVATGLMAGRPAAAISWMFGPFMVWDLLTRNEIRTPATANVAIGEAARGWIETDTGPVVITTHESLVRTHNLLTGAVSQLQPGLDDPVTALAATNDPAHPPAVAIARTDCTVSVVNASTGNETCRLTLPYPASALTWAPSGLLVAACRRDLYCLEVPAS
jgi:WD40 repeat protein